MLKFNIAYIVLMLLSSKILHSLAILKYGNDIVNLTTINNTIEFYIYINIFFMILINIMNFIEKHCTHTKFKNIWYK